MKILTFPVDEKNTELSDLLNSDRKDYQNSCEKNQKTWPLERKKK